MNTRQMKRIRGMLVQRLEALQGTAGRTVSSLAKDGGPCADWMDHAALEHDRQVELAIRGRERDAAQEIRQAIRRIDQGLFGVCLVCGASIAEKRLVAEPTTRLCRSCQELEEMGDGRRRFAAPPPAVPAAAAEPRREGPMGLTARPKRPDKAEFQSRLQRALAGAERP